MLHRHGQLRGLLLAASDLVATGTALGLAYVLRFVLRLFSEPRPWDPGQYLSALPAALVLALVTYSATGTYRPPHGPDSRGSDLRRASGGVLAVTLLLTAVAFLYRDRYQFSRELLLLFPILGVPLVWGGRRIAHRVLAALHRRGVGVSPALLVGEGRVADELRRVLEERTWLGIRVAEQLRRPEEIPDALERVRPGQVFLAFPADRHEILARAVSLLSERMVDVRVVPDLGETLNPDATVIGGLPIVSIQQTPYYGVGRVAKRAFDLMFGIALLVLTSPLLAAAALAVLLGSGRPVFYRQERMGLDGRRFPILKLRTMRADAEAATGAVWSKDGDPRVTAVGRFLRRFSLDELPQLLNVVRGEMSLVGPRPERPELIERFRDRLPGYMLRHRIPAGLTGWAQVHGLRGDTDLAARLRYDLAYLERWSPFLDLEILFRTVWHVLAGTNAGQGGTGRGRMP